MNETVMLMVIFIVVVCGFWFLGFINSLKE